MTDDILKYSSNKQGILTGASLPVDEEQAIKSLRPAFLDDYIGQAEVIETLKIAIQAAMERNEPIDHVLFFMDHPALVKPHLRILLPMRWEVI